MLKKIKPSDKAFDAELDRKFEAYEDLSEHINWESGVMHPPLLPKRVNIDFPRNILEGIDTEAARIGVTRQSLLKMWISERVDALGKSDISL